MGELEPDDSRDVTLTDEHAPGEPPRTGPREGETRGQQQQQGGQSQKQSNWREAEKDRDAQDHEQAGGVHAPSLLAEADDGQWSQQAGDFGHYEAVTQPMTYLSEDDLRLGDELRGPRDSMREPDRSRQYEQAERGGG